MTRILIVDDEPDLVAALQFHLEREGFQTLTALTGVEALARAAGSPAPDIVLLDLMLPDLSGTEVCRRLRADPQTRGIPVVMLTARGEEIDRVVGFEVGADDYVVKPYSSRELLLRVRAVLRRAGEASQEVAEMAVGRLHLDLAGHRCWADGSEVDLTALEFKLLATLVERRGRVQSRDRLIEDVWQVSAMTERTVDSQVKRLRRKLGGAGDSIRTIRGVGYRFDGQAEGS